MNTAYPRTRSLEAVRRNSGEPACMLLRSGDVAVIAGRPARSEIRPARPGAIDGKGMAQARRIHRWIGIPTAIVAIAIVILPAPGAGAFTGCHWSWLSA